MTLTVANRILHDQQLLYFVKTCYNYEESRNSIHMLLVLNLRNTYSLWINFQISFKVFTLGYSVINIVSKFQVS